MSSGWFLSTVLIIDDWLLNNDIAKLRYYLLTQTTNQKANCGLIPTLLNLLDYEKTQYRIHISNCKFIHNTFFFIANRFQIALFLKPMKYIMCIYFRKHFDDDWKISWHLCKTNIICRMLFSWSSTHVHLLLKIWYYWGYIPPKTRISSVNSKLIFSNNPIVNNTMMSNHIIWWSFDITVAGDYSSVVSFQRIFQNLSFHLNIIKYGFCLCPFVSHCDSISSLLL